MSAKDQIKQIVDYFKREPQLKDKTDGMGNGLLLAGELADEANERSKEARLKAVDVDRRYKDFLLENDLNPGKDPELVDIRQGYDTAGERIELFEQKTDARLVETKDYIDQRGVDIKSFGAVGDGITDDTEAIQLALDSGRRIFWSNGDYYFSHLYIRNDNTHIEFADNVVLMSDYAGNNIESGAIEIIGEYLNTVKVMSAIPHNSRVISVEDMSTFEVGDFIKITQTNPSGTDAVLNKQKYCISMLHIHSIDYAKNEIKTIEPIPHAYQLNNNPVVTRIKPVKNVLLNLNNTRFDKMGTTEYASHIVAKGCHNIEINGLVAESGGGKGVSILETHNFRINTITRGKPTNIEAGHGYGVQIARGSCYGKVNDVTAFDNRHGIDVSSGSNHLFFNGYEGFNSDAHTHGGNSRYVYMENCTTYDAGFVIGNYSFYSDDHITLKNCKAYNSIESGFGIHNGSHDVRLVDCETFGCVTGFTISNKESKDIQLINFKTDGNSIHGADLNGTRITVDNLKISNTKNVGVLFREVTNVGVKGLEVTNDSSFEQVSAISYENDSTAITIDGLKVRGKYQRAVKTRNVTGIISVINADIVADSVRLFDLDSSRQNHDFTLNNVVRLESTSPTGLGIFSSEQTKGVKVVNSKLSADVSLQSTSGVVLQNNEIDNININVVGTKDVVVVFNSGKVKDKFLPTSNSTDIIVEQNMFKTT